MDFVIGLVDSVLNLPSRTTKKIFWGGGDFKLQKNCNQSHLSKKNYYGLVKNVSWASMHVYVLATAFPNGKVYFELTFLLSSQSKMKTFRLNFKVRMSNGLIEFVTL